MVTWCYQNTYSTRQAICAKTSFLGNPYDSYHLFIFVRIIIIITIIIIINVSLFMVDKIEILVKYNYTTRREKCLNTELFLVRIQGNTDHK